MFLESRWVWIQRNVIIAAHSAQLAEHGGAAGTRDAGLLDSALARAENLAAYDDPDVAALAATYGFGIVRNHPFVDGNKRTALIATELFLALNGYDLVAGDAECVVTMLDLAAGELPEAEFAAWLRTHIEPRAA
ncbi:MAG: type II toxin-antitoxin system death-on-curing family toxin [Gammaproteobacteria bacterium]|nr:type II toxin-antitoxin system death-on-curing family toxin [Rhodocyclaceae bacterium]MBU3908478.1 type II toxin-antitoxin system death-on-curing family toxin [Gammaproteobacteria bacterium]MBU3988639.1 type II toxin-antitoxin system death-on-curing family toxin [Gammaproteobacteria bacterium]MBU4004506.1 type II toxin-antitoxin system death-on-curing family toxin [Gammaproteobacteria bacterium]MBU4021109.1 type II toxin-antitoxin system death-on-curing family toxin [Gammaproteobacteria bact